MAKILIIEDDNLLSNMYSKIFASKNYEVICAFDGEDGFEKAKKEKPNLILLDIMMPKLNGFQVLEKLKSESDTKNIPVVMLTNLAGERDAESAYQLGAVKYIIKSQYKPKEIEDIVSKILDDIATHSPPSS